MSDTWIKRADYKEHMHEEQREEARRIELKGNEIKSGAKGIIFFVSIPVVLISAALILHDPVLKDMIMDARQEKAVKKVHNADNAGEWEIVTETNVHSNSSGTDIKITVVEDSDTGIQYVLFSDPSGMTVIERKIK